MLGIVSHCANVTLSFYDIPLQKYRDLEIRVRGHSRSLKVAQFDRLPMVSVFFSNFVPKLFDFKNAVTLKSGLGSVKVIGNVTVR